MVESSGSIRWGPGGSFCVCLQAMITHWVILLLSVGSGFAHEAGQLQSESTVETLNVADDNQKLIIAAANSNASNSLIRCISNDLPAQSASLDSEIHQLALSDSLNVPSSKDSHFFFARDNHRGDTEGKLRAVGANLDRDMSHVEVLAEAIRRQRSREPTSPPLPANTDQPSTVPTNFQDSDQKGSSQTEQDSIPVLDEVVIEGEPIDPFDETPAHIIYDPWEGMNLQIFGFNLVLDQFILKPIAMGYDWVMPDALEEGIRNAIHNIRFVPRFANNLFQAKFKSAGIEMTRFLINSTLGIAGFIDVADLAFDLKVSEEDTGQTLGTYDVQPGPYLVLPFFPPMTVRDGIGALADLALDPLTYLLPFVQAGTRGGEVITERARNVDQFDGVQAGTVDLYGAVREAYFQRRERAIKE